MSDSEMDDAWKAVLKSRTKLNEVKQRLRNLEEDDSFVNNSDDLVSNSFLTIFTEKIKLKILWIGRGANVNVVRPVPVRSL